jgi:hypothetical protein
MQEEMARTGHIFRGGVEHLPCALVPGGVQDLDTHGHDGASTN